MQEKSHKIIIFDFSRVLLHPKDPTIPSLNGLYRSLLQQKYFNFFDYYELNNELLLFLKEYRKKYPLYMLTSDTIQNAPEIQNDLNNIFTTIYCAKDFGIAKKDPQLYMLLAKKLQVNPNEIVFVDDTQENINAAKSAGFHTIHYTKNQDLLVQLQKI